MRELSNICECRRWNEDENRSSTSDLVKVADLTCDRSGTAPAIYAAAAFCL